MAKWGTQNLHGLDTDDVSTLLSKDAEFNGTVKIQGSVRVDGTVTGDLVSSHAVTVGATGVIEGNITAEDIIVAGRVKGSLVARGRVLLESSAQFEGDLTATKLAVVEGAVFRGHSNMALGKSHGAPKAEVKAPEPKKETERVAAA
jgi:cytoskeletal protein CcmA (bactofilin family)